MIEIMRDNEIDIFDVKDGQIRYKKEKKREVLTQKKLLNILVNHPQFGKDQAQNLNQYVYDNRKVIESETIIRKVYDS
jgi:UDP-N-acetyl-D-mannosaminuronate dehydrogenase